MNRTENRKTVREKVDAQEREREEEDKARKQQTLKHVMTCARVILSDTRCDTLSHKVMCAQRQICQEKVSCEVCLSTEVRPHQERLQ